MDSKPNVSRTINTCIVFEYSHSSREFKKRAALRIEKKLLVRVPPSSSSFRASAFPLVRILVAYSTRNSQLSAPPLPLVDLAPLSFFSPLCHNIQNKPPRKPLLKPAAFSRHSLKIRKQFHPARIGIPRRVSSRRRVAVHKNCILILTFFLGANIYEHCLRINIQIQPSNNTSVSRITSRKFRSGENHALEQQIIVSRKGLGEDVRV